MFRFEETDWLYVLGAIPFLIAAFLLALRWRKKLLERFGDYTTVLRLVPDMSRFKHTFKFVLLMVGLTLLIIAMANPQWSSKREKVTRKSIDLYLALDISRSMLAMDITPSRLERATRFAQTLVENFKGERMGAIIFAGNAYIQVPLTIDYAALNLFLASANPDLAPTQGTAISEAIDLAERSFGADNKSHKVLIIISDGENHDEEALQSASTAADNGLIIFTIGAGTSEGSFIPVTYNGRSDFLRDDTGNPVKSVLNEALLQELAQTGKGNYYNLLSDPEAIVQSLKEKIEQVEKRDFEQRVFSDYESYFQYFLALALLFFCLEFVIAYSKNNLERKDIFKV